MKRIRISKGPFFKNLFRILEISGFCVTDHCELEEYESGQFAERISQSIFDVGKAAKVFQGRLTLHTGVEISGVHHRPELARQVAGRPFDMPRPVPETAGYTALAALYPQAARRDRKY